MKKEKLLALFLILSVLGTLLSGCGNKEATPPADTHSDAEQAVTPAPDQKKEFVRGETTFERPDIDYPKEAVTIVCPYAAGGGTDLLARIFAEYATKKTGVPFVVTNITGGGTSTGTLHVHDASPDGYTILFSHNVVLVNKWISGTTDFDHTGFENGPMLSEDVASGFFCRADAPYDNFSELVEYSKEHPSEVVVAMETGAFSYAMVKDLMTQCGVEWNLVDAGGNGPKISALLGGQVDVIPNQYGTVKAYIESGDFKCLGFSGHDRSELYPDVPTFEEQGVNAYHPGYTFAIQLPKGTDPKIVEFYDWMAYEMQNDPEAVAKCENIGNVLSNWLPSYSAKAYFDDMAIMYQSIAASME